MGFFRVAKKVVAAGWNVSGWVGASHIKNNAAMIKDLAADNFTKGKQQQSTRKETFTQCMKRLKLSEADIQKRIKNSTQIILICSLLSIPMALYTLYIFSSGFALSGFVCLMLTTLLLAYTFREHFNRFQMQQRRLGCTFQEWLQHLLKSQKKTNPNKDLARNGK